MSGFTVRRCFYDTRFDSGFWSPSTSTANFCEEDYVVSHYIAEFINTLTNAAYIYYALYPPTVFGKLHSKTKPASNGFDDSQRHSITWDLQTVALVLVGTSSGIFHMSLHAWPQWCDESSMYLLAASWIHALLTTTYVKTSTSKQMKAAPAKQHRVNRQNELFVGAFIALVIALASMSTVWTGHLAIHSIMFAVLLVVSGIKLIYLIIVATSAAQDWNATIWGPSVDGMNQARRMLFTSLAKAIFLLVAAFALWLCDSNPAVCAYLRYVRNDFLGQTWYLRPLGFLTELHGWWHVLTARAAGEYIALIRVLTCNPNT